MHPDDWWGEQPLERKQQIMRWLTPGPSGPVEVPEEQLALLGTHGEVEVP